MADQNVRARRHDALKKFANEVRKGYMERVADIAGSKFLLHTPTEDDVIWADAFIRPSTPLSYASSRRAPRLAAAIKMIDGVKLEDLFLPPEDATDEDKERLKDPSSKKYWLQSQLMLYLVEDVPPPVLEKLYDEYDKLLKERDAVLKLAVEDPNS
jgi:hypothetical protein